MKKAYIAGKITDDPDYREKFAYVAEHLKSRGYAVMSPAVMSAGFEYEDYMHVCFAMMHVCRTGTIFMLPNWKESPGAMREHDNAVELGMIIEYLTWSDVCG